MNWKSTRLEHEIYDITCLNGPLLIICFTAFLSTHFSLRPMLNLRVGEFHMNNFLLTDRSWFDWCRRSRRDQVRSKRHKAKRKGKLGSSRDWKWSESKSSCHRGCLGRSNRVQFFGNCVNCSGTCSRTHFEWIFKYYEVSNRRDATKVEWKIIEGNFKRKSKMLDIPREFLGLRSKEEGGLFFPRKLKISKFKSLK